MDNQVLEEDGTAVPAAGTSTSSIATFKGRMGGSETVTKRKPNDIVCGTTVLESEEDNTDPEAYFKKLGDKFKTDDLEVGAGKEEEPVIDTNETDDDIVDILSHDFDDSFTISRNADSDNFTFTSKLFNTSFVLPQSDLIQASDTKPNEVDVFPTVNIALSKDGIKEAIRIANLMQKKELPIDASPSPEYINSKQDEYELENGIEMPKMMQNSYPLIFKIARSIFMGKNADYVKGGFRLKEDTI